MEVTEGRLKTRGCDLLRVVRKLQPITVVLVLVFQELTRRFLENEKKWREAQGLMKIYRGLVEGATEFSGQKCGFKSIACQGWVTLNSRNLGACFGRKGREGYATQLSGSLQPM